MAGSVSETREEGSKGFHFHLDPLLVSLTPLIGFINPPAFESQLREAKELHFKKERDALTEEARRDNPEARGADHRRAKRTSKSSAVSRLSTL